MDDLKDWVPLAALVVAAAGFVLQLNNRRDARRAAGLHVGSAVRDGRALIQIQKIGDAPIFNVEIQPYAGTSPSRARLPVVLGEMTRNDPTVKVALLPNSSGHAAVEISYRTMIQGGRTVRFVWDAVNHRRLGMALNVRARLGTIPHHGQEVPEEASGRV